MASRSDRVATDAEQRRSGTQGEGQRGDEDVGPQVTALATDRRATVTDLAARLPITRQAIAKHLTLLVDSGLLRLEPGERRRVRYRVRTEAIAQQYLAALADTWDSRLDALVAT